MPKSGIHDEELLAQRIAIAEVEKRRTHGEILRDGLLGPDDKRIGRGEQSKQQKARPSLKVDGRKDATKVIEGKPRTGKVNW